MNVGVRLSIFLKDRTPTLLSLNPCLLDFQLEIALIIYKAFILQWNLTIVISFLRFVLPMY